PSRSTRSVEPMTMRISIQGASSSLRSALVRGRPLLLSALPALAASALLAQQPPEKGAAGDGWWAPGDARPFPAYVEYANEAGRLGIVNTEGDIDTTGHPFFEALGTNGRGCVSCHQPADGMSLSLASIRERWEATGGADPIFAPIDGMDCPHLPRGDAASHSLLLQRGLFRVPLPWPPRDAAGEAVEPEFTLEVVRDPTGCNTHPV